MLDVSDSPKLTTLWLGDNHLTSLNLDNKVSLFARVIDLDTGESGDMIFNKYDPVCSDFDDPEEPELLPEELELLKKLDAEEE